MLDIELSGFSPPACVNPSSKSIRSPRPPTSTPNITTPPTPMRHKPRRATRSSAFNCGVNARSDSTQIARAPTYTANVTPAPSYTSQDPSAREHSGGLTKLIAHVRSVLEWILSHTCGVVSVFQGKPHGPRYIYYRVYTEDGAIPSAHPAFSDDRYLGRILADHVTPPHTVTNLKNSLSGYENIDESVSTSLFVTASSQAPMDDTACVSIRAYPGPGCTSDKPMALLAAFSSSKPPPEIVITETAEEDRPLPEIRYIYYRFYNLNKRGAVRSKLPADPDDPYIGRILVDIVPPPHTVESIIRCISKVEKPESSSQLQLFVSISSQAPIVGGHISILTRDSPGSTPDDPMALVEVPPRFLAHPDFTQQLLVKHSFNPGDCSNEWLEVTAGAILYTNNEGIKLRSLESYTPTTRQPLYSDYLSFEAINEDGKLGFVRSADVELH